MPIPAKHLAEGSMFEMIDLGVAGLRSLDRTTTTQVFFGFLQAVDVSGEHGRLVELFDGSARAWAFSMNSAASGRGASEISAKVNRHRPATATPSTRAAAPSDRDGSERHTRLIVRSILKRPTLTRRIRVEDRLRPTLQDKFAERVEDPGMRSRRSSKPLICPRVRYR